jgi:hypothetical protein
MYDIYLFSCCISHTKPHTLQNARDCIAAFGDKMNSLGIYEIDLQINGNTFTHQIYVINQLNDNIIGIYFMNKHKLHYDVQTRLVRISSIDTHQIVTLKEQVLPALASTIMNIKYKG